MAAAYALSSGLGLLADDSDRRFRRVLAIFAIPALVLGIVIPWIHIPGLLKDGALITPMRQAKLIQQAPEKSVEPERAKPLPGAKPKPQLTREQKVEKARAKAQKAIASLQDSLAELREADLPKVGGPLKSSVLSSATGTNPDFAEQAGRTSGGIGDTAAIGRVSSSTSVGQRNTAKVHSRIGEGRDTGVGGGRAGRTLEELQLVFDRTKGAFYTMYQRELRQNPNMRGKVVLRITIAASGRVTRCSVVSSELHDPEFEKKVAARVLLMDFGPKAVGDFTVDYPIYFFPQN